MTAVLAAGLNLLGGLLGRRKPEAQGVDFSKLRDDAIAAGFNPLTALAATGGQGYTRQAEGSLASADLLARAATTAADFAFDRGADAAASRREQGIRARSLGGRQGLKRSGFGYDLTSVVPMKTASTVGLPPVFSSAKAARPVPLRGPAGSSVAPAYRFDDPEKGAQSDRNVNPPEIPVIAFGYRLIPSGLFSDGDTFETRYGDRGGSYMGGAALVTDIVQAVGRELHADGVRRNIAGGPMGFSVASGPVPPVFSPLETFNRWERGQRGRVPPVGPFGVPRNGSYWSGFPWAPTAKVSR